MKNLDIIDCCYKSKLRMAKNWKTAWAGLSPDKLQILVAVMAQRSDR
jgi:hypothetical protein